jgi:hypothetical protein
MSSASFQPAATADDGYWDSWWSGFQAGLDFIQLADGPTPATDSTNGFIFLPTVDIPKGATIQSAVWRFEADRSDSASAVTLQIIAADQASPSRPTSKAECVAPARTSAAVSWQPAAWTAGNEYTTTDLAAVVQELVDLAAWASGNPMLFYFEKTASGGTRRICAEDDATGALPVLDVTWSTANVPAATSPIAPPVAPPIATAV